jgi:hypothetical protein
VENQRRFFKTTAVKKDSQKTAENFSSLSEKQSDNSGFVQLTKPLQILYS